MLKNKVKTKNYQHIGLTTIDKNISDEDENGEMYESMIENGTSDENGSQEEIEEANSEISEDEVAEDESDDEFSDKESVGEEERTNNVATKMSHAIKRKTEEEITKSIAKKLKNDSFESKALFKAPTVEEINKLRESEEQFHSNLFRLQIDEMLKELRIKNKMKNAIDEWLNKFNLFLNKLDSQDEKQDSEHLMWSNDMQIKNPFCRKNTIKKKFYFQFLKPSKPAFFVGSMISDTLIDSLLKIDVCVEIPAKIFQKGDYLNMIYEEKRSLYILYLAHKMVGSKQFDSEHIHYNYYQNNRLKTVLEINIDGKYENKIVFRIFPVPEKDSFKLNRFVPWNSNIRSSLFTENSSEEDELLYATPNYNSNVLIDLTMKENNELIQSVIGSKPNLRDGLILLKIWLKQRNLSDGSAGFGNHVMTIFVIWLFQQRKLHAGMSSYQIARNVWHQLSCSTWNEENKGLTLCTVLEAESNQPTLEQMHQYFDLVFIDFSGYLNICCNMSLDTYLRIKYESSRVIELLNDNKINSFQQIFMTKLPHYVQYDHLFGFKRSDIREILDHDEQKADKNNFAGYWLPHAIKIVTKVLRKGLSDRILSLTPLETTSESWSVTSNPPKINNILKIGLVLNPERAFDVIDKGPQANDPTANEFRQFWGDKSELRRFQDGSITEACVWAAANASLREKRLTVKNIVLHLLELHFQVEKISYLADQFDHTYQLDKEYCDSTNDKVDAEYSTVDVIKNFDDIGKKLRALQDLPLDITGIQGISPVFRYAEPVPILNNARFYLNREKNKLIFKAHRINYGIIELGTSGKWPNELPAFRRLKTAFNIQFGNALSKTYKLKVRSGVDGIHIFNNGYLYRIEISHPKEISLLKKSVTAKGIVQYVDTTESIQLEKRLSILPKVTSALHGLYQQFSSYGPTVMISKRWLNSQLIDSHHWPDECTELLVAYQFLKHNTLTNPCQPQTGFLRFLHLLANTDWKTEMFFLNFNDEINQKEIIKLEERFIKQRDTFPTLFIATSFDENKYGLWWSKESLNTHILARVTILARCALEILKPSLALESKLKVNNLFIPTLDGYDAIITIKGKLIEICHAYNFRRDQLKLNKGFVPSAGSNLVLRGLNELREGYSDFAIFFYNPYGGYEIAVKWKPNIFEPKEFNLSSVNGCAPYEDDKIACTPEKLIADFKIILNGLYDRIELK